MYRKTRKLYNGVPLAGDQAAAFTGGAVGLRLD